MRKTIFLFLSFLFVANITLAQQTVTGKVTDANGMPLADVSVKSKKTGKGTTTATDGSFRLSVSAKDELEFSSVGYESQTVPAGAGEIKVVLVQSTEELSQVVMVGTRGMGRAKTRNSCAGGYHPHQPGRFAYCQNGSYFRFKPGSAIL
jgi:hypothetical protein